MDQIEDSALRGTQALGSWVGSLMRTSKLLKERTKIVDQFIYLVYGTVVSQHDGHSNQKAIDITDGVIMTELLSRARLSINGTEMPSQTERNLFLLKPRLEIISTYLQECKVFLNLEISFSAQQFIQGEVPPHILVEHFFALYAIVAEGNGLPVFHFDRIFPRIEGDVDTSQFQMEQLQDTIKCILSPQREPPKESGANKFSVAMKASPAFRFVNRDRLIKKMENFYAPLHQQRALASFSHTFTDAALDCERLHIDDFDEYYQRVLALERAKAGVEKKLDKRNKENNLLKEIVQSQNKLLDGLNLDIGLLASENALKAKVAAQKLPDSGLQGTNSTIKKKPERDLIKESRRLSQQIRRLTFNFQKQILQEGPEKNDPAEISEGESTNSEKSVVSTRSIGIQNGFPSPRNLYATLPFKSLLSSSQTSHDKFQQQLQGEGQEATLQRVNEESLRELNDSKEQQVHTLDQEKIINQVTPMEGGVKQDWIKEKWEEVIQTLQREKMQLEEELRGLNERNIFLETASSSPQKLRQLEVKLKDQQLVARRHEQEYSILLSENTRLRNELDQTLRTSRPLAEQLDQATKEIRSGREQNREYRKLILELKGELARLSNWATVADKDQDKIKGLVNVLESRIKHLQAKNNELKAQIQFLTTSTFNKAPTRFT